MMTVQPIPGPLQAPPDVSPDAAKMMLDNVLDDLELGAWDAEVRTWVEFADPAYVAAVASWCRRSWQAGVEVGHTECVEEIAGYHQAIAVARAALDRSERRAPDGP